MTFWLPAVLVIIALMFVGNAYNADIMFSVTISSPDIESTTKEIAPIWIVFLLPLFYSAHAIVFTLLWNDEEDTNSKWSEIYKFIGIMFLISIGSGIIKTLLLIFKVST